MKDPLTIDERRVDEHTILDLAGPLLMGKGEQQLTERLAQLRAEGIHRVAVNLGDVPFIDSAGVSALVQAVQVARREGGRCLLFAASPRVRKLLEMLRLDGALGILDDEAAALAALRGSDL